MITYDAETATLRGTPARIDSVRSSLSAAADAEEGSRILADAGVDIPADDRGDVVAALVAALDRPVFTVSLTVSGPGGHQHHRMDAGQNAVGVRQSPLREDLAELSAFPVVNLPGGMTRLVRFRPGVAPAPDARAIEVAADALVDLADEDRAVRLRAWAEVSARLGGAVDSQDTSWQLVQSRAEWTTPAGELTHDLAVHLRCGDHYYVVVESDQSVELVPVASITAWETMICVLPGADEVGRPA